MIPKNHEQCDDCKNYYEIRMCGGSNRMGQLFCRECADKRRASHRELREKEFQANRVRAKYGKIPT